METKLAEASLDNVALRDPQQTDHKTTVAELREMMPHFDWSAYFRATDVPEADLNIQEPKFMQAFNAMLAGSPVGDWKIYLKWHLLRAAVKQGLTLEQTRKQVNLDRFRTQLAGDDIYRQRAFRDFYLEPGIGQAYKEAKGEPRVE
jgi:predicted metalloendopeptidase